MRSLLLRVLRTARRPMMNAFTWNSDILNAALMGMFEYVKFTSSVPSAPSISVKMTRAKCLLGCLQQCLLFKLCISRELYLKIRLHISFKKHTHRYACVGDTKKKRKHTCAKNLATKIIVISSVIVINHSCNTLIMWSLLRRYSWPNAQNVLAKQGQLARHRLGDTKSLRHHDWARAFAWACRRAAVSLCEQSMAMESAVRPL